MILTDEQKQILDDFRDLISGCMTVIQYRYNSKYPDLYNESIPATEMRILQAFENFNDKYDWQGEIAKMIDGKSYDEICLYINDILCYFKVFSDVYYPYALIDRWNGYICEYQVRLKEVTDDAEKAAYNKTITTFENQIRNAKEKAVQYEDIALTFKDKTIAGSSFKLLVWWEHRFANILDAELAKRGIDLMPIQKQAGVYVKSPICSIYTRATDIMDLVGSFELAENYIKALQTQKGNDCNNDVGNGKFDSSVLKKVYTKCNGELWIGINEDSFNNMMASGKISINVKNKNKKRVTALFYRLSFLIDDENIKPVWMANVELSLGVERLSRSYKLDEQSSKQNKEFNQFLDEIYSK